MTEPTKKHHLATLVLGVVVMSLGVLTIWQGVSSRAEDNEQRQCLANSFGQLTEALEIRGQNAAAEAANDRRDNASQNQLIFEVFAAKTKQESLAAFERFREAQVKIQRQAQKIRDTRARHPFPSFPPGTCESGLPHPQPTSTP